jgi:prepilin-type N-terminal cleavage/methylation domain-containing protein
MELDPIMIIKRNTSLRIASLRKDGESGFSLLEVMFAMVVLAVGMLAVLASLGIAIGANETSQQDMLARQIASEAMESIFNARNTSQLGFTAINSTTASPPGVFLPNAQSPMCAGPDGIIGTADDVACTTASGTVCPNAGIECLTEPGPDGIVGTADDVIVSLANYTRTITITPLLENGTVVPTLVLVTITINYTVPNHAGAKSYVLEEEISSYH